MLLLWFAAMNQASAQHMMGHHGGADSLHRNHTGLFLGATIENTKENMSGANSSFTLGIHHEMFARSRTPYINVGIMGEVIFAGDNEFLGVIPIYFHPAPMLKFWIGPGVRATTHPDEKYIDNYNDSMMGNWQSDFLVRIGGAYEFHFDEYTVSPTISADILNHRTYMVLGIVFGLSY